MNRFERFERVVRVVAVSAVGSAAILVHHLCQDILRGNPPLVMGLAMVLLTALLALLELGVEKLKAIRWIRKYLIFRKDWIEGVWFDFLVDTEAKKILGYGLITIHFSDDQLKVSGCGMSPMGVEIAPFESSLVMCKADQLRYLYEKDGGATIGLSEYNFLRIGEKAHLHDYTGWFLETSAPTRYKTRAFLISDKKVLKILQDPIKRHTAVETLISTYKDLAVTKPELIPSPFNFKLDTFKFSPELVKKFTQPD